MPQLEMTTEQAARLGPLIANFKRSIERQRQRDGEILAGLVRGLRSTRTNNDAERFADFVRNIVRQEIVR